jgi:hypothetical protein
MDHRNIDKLGNGNFSSQYNYNIDVNGTNHNSVYKYCITTNPMKTTNNPSSTLVVVVAPPIVPIAWPCKRPLNYHEYKKDLDIHVKVFKLP